MWTAAWWWKLQKLLPPGATIAPIILSSDKTKLSNFCGDQSAWPVYLTIGKISKDFRRQASSHATVLVGYLPISTFHHCMSIITKSLISNGTNSVDMMCADGFVRWVWPILAMYVTEYPEQCLVANCMENSCPICKVNPSSRVKCEVRGDWFETCLHTSLGYIFQSFMPDLLHQLHKGVFKDHLVKWCTNIVTTKEVDACFHSMTPHPGVRHFKNGISMIGDNEGLSGAGGGMDEMDCTHRDDL
ncbi:hypothetical protein B0H10DRAFT_2168059 [Mycena sp. CBHHK59/15]|nr:hypothetical protein B0H10DRAFT_2168059 [Mycena sp. CBHHK59/15]